MTDQSAPAWRRSSLCDSAACVEVTLIGEDIAVRDSKNPDGPILKFTREEWIAFQAGIRNGDFQFN